MIDSTDISVAQRWMQFLITTTTIVISTGTMVWAVMVYALDSEYVQIEDFETFKQEIKTELEVNRSSTQRVVDRAVATLQCDLLRSELNDLDATILYKTDHSIPSGLDTVLRDQKLRELQSRTDCNGGSH